MSLTSVKLFSIGHALELYLKASYTKMTGNIKAAIDFRHNVGSLWKACKSLDASFIPGFELRDSVLAGNLLSQNETSKLPKEDYFHFLEHQELYVIAKHLADLKYLGAPLMSVTGAYTLVYMFPNPDWIAIFAAIRRFLQYPDANTHDTIRHVVESEEIPAAAAQYLSGLLT
jgi:hypothetical protein